MTEFELALEAALRLQARGESLDDLLARYPQYADDLKPLLETAEIASVGLMKDEPLPAPDLRRGRERFLRAALGTAPRQRESTPARPILRVAAALALAVVAFTLAAAGLVIASESALPGDALYPAKRVFEQVELSLVVDPAEHEALRAQFNARRRSETQAAAAQGRQVQVQFEGVVERIDRGSLTVSGLSLRAESGRYRVGDRVLVEARTTAEGQIVADRIRVIFSPGISPTPVPPADEPTLPPSSTDTRPVEPSPSPASPRPSPATTRAATRAGTAGAQPAGPLPDPTQMTPSARPTESRPTPSGTPAPRRGDPVNAPTPDAQPTQPGRP